MPDKKGGTKTAKKQNQSKINIRKPPSKKQLNKELKEYVERLNLNKEQQKLVEPTVKLLERFNKPVPKSVSNHYLRLSSPKFLIFLFIFLVLMPKVGESRSLKIAEHFGDENILPALEPNNIIKSYGLASISSFLENAISEFNQNSDLKFEMKAPDFQSMYYTYENSKFSLRNDFQNLKTIKKKIKVVHKSFFQKKQKVEEECTNDSCRKCQIELENDKEILEQMKEKFSNKMSLENDYGQYGIAVGTPIAYNGAGGVKGFYHVGIYIGDGLVWDINDAKTSCKSQSTFKTSSINTLFNFINDGMAKRNAVEDKGFNIYLVSTGKKIAGGIRGLFSRLIENTQVLSYSGVTQNCQQVAFDMLYQEYISPNVDSIKGKICKPQNLTVGLIGLSYLLYKGGRKSITWIKSWINRKKGGGKGIKIPKKRIKN